MPRPATTQTTAPRRLTVAVLGPSRFPVAEPYVGGLESFVGGLVAALRARGHRVLLFAAAGSTGAQPEVLAGGGWEPDELSREDPSMPAEAFLREHQAHLTVLNALRTTYAGQVDVVHNNSLHHLPLTLSSTLPFPTVTTLHTPPTPWLTAALAAGGSSHAFTAVSRFTARQWAPWVSAADVVHNGVDPRRWALGPGGGGLLWFGRLVPEKAPHLAMDAAARAGHHLDLVGPALDAGYFSAQIAPRLGPSATWHGHLGGAQLSAAVGRAGAVLVTPVWEEPFGLVAAEAAMCGTPVVAFDRGGISEVLRPNVGDPAGVPAGVVVPADDVAAMAAAIPAALALDRAGVRTAALAHLSAATMVGRYEAVLRAAVAGVPGAPGRGVGAVSAVQDRVAAS
ncbi:glycosyltransferase [Kineococcus sp. TBRC 1896]|uniref:Glycosyltransferase n=1 Tax=Kineococcus mangrovi TaxID=1660183 RepID=A0ABV4HZE5_9ACTN